MRMVLALWMAGVGGLVNACAAEGDTADLVKRVAEENLRTEQRCERLFQLQANVENNRVNVGEKISLSLTFTNKLPMPFEFRGATRLEEQLPAGLVVRIFRSDGSALHVDTSRIREHCGQYESSKEVGNLQPGESKSIQFNLPEMYTPDRPDRYTLSIEYRQGGFVDGGGYEKSICIKAPAVNFEVFPAPSPRPWRETVLGKKDEDLSDLLRETAEAPETRHLLFETICSAEFPLPTRLQAAQTLRSWDFPYSDAIVKLMLSSGEPRELRMAAIGLLPCMEGEWPDKETAGKMLRRILDSGGSDPEWAVAALVALRRTATPPTLEELQSWAEDKGKDPSVRAAALFLLLDKATHKGGFGALRKAAQGLLDLDVKIDAEMLNRHLGRQVKGTAKETAQVFLKMIDMLEHE